MTVPFYPTVRHPANENTRLHTNMRAVFGKEPRQCCPAYQSSPVLPLIVLRPSTWTKITGLVACPAILQYSPYLSHGVQRGPTSYLPSLRPYTDALRHDSPIRRIQLVANAMAQTGKEQRSQSFPREAGRLRSRNPFGSEMIPHIVLATTSGDCCGA